MSNKTNDQNDKTPAGLLARPGSAAWVEAVGKLANQEAMKWDTLWQNHDPSFLSACRSAFADGFMRGFYMRDEMPPNPQAQRPAVNGE